MGKRKILLDFEKPLHKLQAQLTSLREISGASGIDLSEDIDKLEQKAEKLKQKIYGNLSVDQIIQIARYARRPTAADYIAAMCTDFVEVHGDRCFRDDPAIIAGFAKLDTVKVAIIGHQKGKDTRDNIYRNFGMAQPDGYRKAVRVMKLAEKFSRPVITLVDTPGAYPGIEAEERGQAEAIAKSIYEMSSLEVPVLSVITGEGGSGGALGIAVANEVHMLQYAIYSVISPEGCAAILWNDASKALEAAKALKITAFELRALGVIDGIIPEPPGGAHNDHRTMAQSIKSSLLESLNSFKGMTPEDIREHRFKKFRSLGVFAE